jgi:AH receptor-interacting protein
MNESEKIKALPKLKEDGNLLYQKKQFSEASKLYAQAIGILEQLQLKY